MSLRLFAALPIPAEIAARLTPLQTGVPGARWSPPDNFHITLRYFGACDRAARRAGMPAMTRRYTPHVTLAYLRGAEVDPVRRFERRAALFSTPAFTADRFYLYSSWSREGEPNLYRVEAEYPLG